MSKITRRCFALGAMGATAGILSERAGAGAEARRDIDPADRQAMEAAAVQFMEKYGVPGLSVAIARGGSLVYVQALGMADTAGEKLTPEHRFRIASVSKPITSVAIFTLVEQGKLKLSDRVFGKGAVFGQGFGTPPYGPHIEEITVEHLLTHTCGGWQNDGHDPMFSHPKMNHAPLISWTLDNLPLEHVPGEHYAYSNFGFCLLGRVIEKITGKPYAEYVRREVLRRCGVSDMEIAGNTLDDRKRKEVVYYGQDGENPYGMRVDRMDSHGGWLATPTDLVRFLVRVDGFPTVLDILELDTLRTMTTGSAANPGYAKGWIVNRENNWWHNGSLPGTITIMVRTSGEFCWAALTNTRRPGSQMDGDLDRLIWDMIGKVTRWPAPASTD